MNVFWTIAIAAGCAGLGYVIRMVEEGWKTAGRVIEQARADVAKPCPCPFCRDARLAGDRDA